MKLNIYKIISNKKNDLELKLDYNLEKISSQTIKDLNFDFWFSKEPEPIDIWRVDKYKTFLENLTEKPKNKVYFAVMIIETKDLCYAISFGKSHFYLKDFCEHDFGLNLAERISNGKIKLKNSKFFKSKRNTVITSYQGDTDFSYDAGEATIFLKSETIDEKRRGKTASFGQSIGFNIDIEINQIPELIKDISNTLEEEKIFPIPKIEQLKSNTDRYLQELIKSILSKNNEKSIDDVKLFGINIIFSDQYEYSFSFYRNESDKFKAEDFRIKFYEFIKDFGLSLENNIDKIKIKIYKETGQPFSNKFINFIDYIPESNQYICLTDGKRYCFNQSYTEYLKNQIDMMEFEEKTCYSRYKRSQQDVLKKAFREKQTSEKKQKNDHEPYDEELFNFYCENSEGYINCDRVIEMIDKKYKIEKMDLYKDLGLYFVKIGDSQKLGYTIDQANNTIKYLQKGNGKIEIKGNEIKIKEIVLRFIIERKTKLKSLSDIDSMILHMKLIDWKKNVTDAGFKPKVYIEYK